MLNTTSALVQSHQVGLRPGVGNMDAVSDLVRSRLVLILWIDPHPMPRRPSELDDLGSCVSTGQIILELDGVRLIQKRANLHAPLSCWIDSGMLRRRVCVDSNLCSPRAIDI